MKVRFCLEKQGQEARGKQRGYGNKLGALRVLGGTSLHTQASADPVLSQGVEDQGGDARVELGQAAASVHVARGGHVSVGRALCVCVRENSEGKANERVVRHVVS